jgi:hypothetical protein
MKRFYSTSNLPVLSIETNSNFLDIPRLDIPEKNSPKTCKKHNSRKSAHIFFNSPLSLLEKPSKKDSKICISDFWKNENKLILRRKFKIQIKKAEPIPSNNQKKVKLPRISRKSSHSNENFSGSGKVKSSEVLKSKTIDQIIEKCNDEINRKKKVRKSMEEITKTITKNLVKVKTLLSII